MGKQAMGNIAYNQVSISLSKGVSLFFSDTH